VERPGLTRPETHGPGAAKRNADAHQILYLPGIDELRRQLALITTAPVAMMLTPNATSTGPASPSSDKAVFWLVPITVCASTGALHERAAGKARSGAQPALVKRRATSRNSEFIGVIITKCRIFRHIHDLRLYPD
jgi:hypothetical protein